MSYLNGRKEDMCQTKPPHCIDLRGVHTVVHEAILPRTFVRVRPS